MTRNEELRLEHLLTILEEMKKNLIDGLNESREEFIKQDVNTLLLEINALILFSKIERQEDEGE